MSARAILPFLCAAALTLAVGPGLARVGVVVGIAPPAPAIEVVPAPPAPGYVWQPGYWSWNGVQYVWVPGVYVAPPFVHAVWVPGRWVRHGGGWVWAAGHWRHWRR
jgi:YXWGXW repeat-containing protein